MKYVIFKTNWGYFGIAGNDSAIYRTYLPSRNSEQIEKRLIRDFPDIKRDNPYFKSLQKQIIAYFQGENLDFSTDIPLFIDNFTVFSRRILVACRSIKSGSTITYADLARKAGYPNAGRAVGNVMAKNPLPLIIPCHRVIRSDGKLGGFTAPGGINLKKRLLLHEKAAF
jgi:O-6-methylguanine DNA methyltransferase